MKRLIDVPVIAGTLAAFVLMAHAAMPPEPQTYKGITYVEGGVGQDEVEAMRSVVKGYNLVMLFATEGTGQFLADVDVTVTDRKKNIVLEAKSVGPCLFAKMPNGTYTVQAVRPGKSFTRNVTITGAKRQELNLYWPNTDKDEPPERTAERIAEAAKEQRHTDCT
jgi:hypothetical protein